VIYKVNTIELRKAMIEKNITTIEGLAKEAGVDRNTIGGILNGKTKPTSTIIEKIASALDLDGPDIGRIFFSRNLA
jgi:transcriptional regulator with XRE-family HTH domain